MRRIIREKIVTSVIISNNEFTKHVITRCKNKIKTIFIKINRIIYCEMIRFILILIDYINRKYNLKFKFFYLFENIFCHVI